MADPNNPFLKYVQGNIYTLPPSPLQQAQATETGARTGQIGQSTAQAAAKFPVDMRAANAEAVLKEIQAADAQRKQQDSQQADRARKIGSVLDADNVIGAINEASGHIGPWTTGGTGKLLSHIPPILGHGGDAYNLAQNLQTVGGNVAFNKYTTMKENMPAGAQGGIRLTDNEINLLRGLQGSLDQGQDPNTLKAHLHNVDQQYRRNAAMAAGVDPANSAVQQQLGIDPTDPNSLTARMGGAPNLAGVAPQQAQSALAHAQAILAKQIAGLPKQARQVGINKFNSDPTIQQLRAIITAPPPRKQAPQGHPGDISAIMAKYGVQ